MAKVAWTPRALDDLREIYEFIARDSASAAEVMADRFFEASERLEGFPQSGPVVPEFPSLDYRQILVGSYRLIYRQALDKVWISAVVHGMRLLDKEP